MARPSEIVAGILITAAVGGLLGLTLLHARGDKPLATAATTAPAAVKQAETAKPAEQKIAADDAAPPSDSAAAGAAPPAKEGSPPQPQAKETAPGGGAAAPQANTAAPDTSKPAPQGAAGAAANSESGKAASSDESGGKAADQAADQQGGEDKAASADADGSPAETAKAAEKGSLKSPYSDFKTVADEGHKKFMAAGCNGCHGGTGGGGMGPPLTNPIWVYGSDDDTLFRLVALGTDELQKQGYTRKGSENVVGPMPEMGTVVKSNDDLWKIIAWIRSINPSSAGGSSASAAPESNGSPQ